MTRAFAAAAGALLAVAAASSCVEPQDEPSNVHDLRVLGARLDPPELIADSCDGGPAAMLPQLAQSVRYTALVLDPAGEGRAIRAELSACPGTDGGVCYPPEDTFVVAPEQDVAPGEVAFDLGLFAFTGAPENPLLLTTLARDRFGGLGGVRVPLVLHLRAGQEEIFAQKLMVFGCRFFPEMTANVNPELPGVRLEGAPWPPDQPPLLSGQRAFEIEAEPFSDREEPYVVPSFSLEPVHLVERWLIAWHADYGTIAPYETGGADFGGGEARHRVAWTPPPGAGERDVRFWMVVRDGRGGTSWISRTARFRP